MLLYMSIYNPRIAIAVVSPFLSVSFSFSPSLASFLPPTGNVVVASSGVSAAVEIRFLCKRAKSRRKRTLRRRIEEIRRATSFNAARVVQSVRACVRASVHARYVLACACVYVYRGIGQKADNTRRINARAIKNEREIECVWICR